MAVHRAGRAQPVGTDAGREAGQGPGQAVGRDLGRTEEGELGPPRLVGVDRTLRRRGSGAIVSVRLRGRPWHAVLADMIEGVVAVNRLAPPAADRVRADLWRACAELTQPVVPRAVRPAVR